MNKLDQDQSESGAAPKVPVTRRQLLNMAGVGALGLAIGGSVPSSVAAGSTGGNGGCGPVTPEGEIGPFFADDSAKGFNRRKVVANVDGSNPQHGIPLTLKLTVYDTQNACAPVKGAQLDIWHCNAEGLYSDEESQSTAGQTYLRGYQLTDAHGMATFETIFPGWYPGRTTHIHLRVRSKYSETSSPDDGSNTTQLFFPQAVVDHINSSIAPYNRHGRAFTTNASDHVYDGETHAQMLVSLSGSVETGFTATAAIYLPITSE